MQIIIITPPIPVRNEALICNALFAHGLEVLHLRKPGCGLEVYEQFIRQIEVRYRNRIVIHEHYELAARYRLRGLHLRAGEGEDSFPKNTSGTVSVSCHSTKEIQQLPFRPDYCFLSPIFDSVSKKGYYSHFDNLPDLSGMKIPVVALGGITPDRIDQCRLSGFQGVATLGYIWEDPDEALPRFIRLKTPFVMSIAGFDPSSGAGVIADIKTFEATGSYGLGICSAVTFQNEEEYMATHWISWEEIRQQCMLQLTKHCPAYIKIGLIENFDLLDRLTAYLLEACPEVKIIWDPILKASSGFIFHDNHFETLGRLLKRIYLITPNTEECAALFGNDLSPKKLQDLCLKYQLYILRKGGHDEGMSAIDNLVGPDENVCFSVKRSKFTKHGTGCVLSAAIVSALAQGYSLPEACRKAQLYVSAFINSNNSLLGYHILDKVSFSVKPSPLELNLQYITAPKEGFSPGEQVEAVCRGGMRWVQLRMKGASFADLIREGWLIKEICRKYNALFIVNDDVEVAKQLDADGVHLGKEDMDPARARKILGREKIIGATCNTWEDILLRQRQGVDYIGLGPFTFTTTKEKLSPVLGLEGYRKLLGLMRQNDIPIPVFAIGGITGKDIPGLMQTGIQGIALSGVIRDSPDLSRKTSEIIRLLYS